MGDTYLFRVGLLGVLAKQFTGVLLLHPFYIGYTMALGGYRVAELHKEGFEMNQLWELPYFVPLSVCHKIVAAIYYVGEGKGVEGRCFGSGGTMLWEWS